MTESIVMIVVLLLAVLGFWLTRRQRWARPKTVVEVIEDQLYQAQVDRLRAAEQAEHQVAFACMLDERVTRLLIERHAAVQQGQRDGQS